MSADIVPMDAIEYREAIRILGLSQRAASDWLGVSPRTGQKYAKDGPPQPVAILLRLTVAASMTAQTVTTYAQPIRSGYHDTRA